jgi:class 3 adenylate cyclase
MLPNNKIDFDTNDDSRAESTDHAAQDYEIKEKRQTLAQKETKAVSLLRIVVFVVLLVTAVIVSFGVFLFTHGAEKDSFHINFEAHAVKIVEAFQYSVERKMGAVDALSVTITSHALATGATFPNVTIPHFEVRGANTRILSDGLLIYWLPLVTDKTRKGWEAYSTANQAWFDQAFVNEAALRERQDEEFRLGARRDLQEPPVFNKVIFGTEGESEVRPEGSGPYLPLWQMTPVVPIKNVLNFDLLTHAAAKDGLNAALNSGQAVIDFASNLKDPNDEEDSTTAIFNLFLAFGQYRHTIETYTGDPSSLLAYPVFDKFDENRTVVGLLAVNQYWSLYAHGVLCVLENSKQKFTYRIDGPQVTFLGPGDQHDPHYDHMGVSEDVTTYVQDRAGPETRAFTVVKLNGEYCSFTIRVYPSKTMEDYYVTSQPIIYTIVVALIFLFTSLVFILYDYLVERRQYVVMDRAVTSSAIVSSLFPANVRDRLFEEGNPKEEADKNGGAWHTTTNKQRVQNFLDGSSTGKETSKPIADLFHNTTVFFGDLVGFTAWSSKRQPEQVFELLETLFAAFDALADKRGVFKIETIGDCYVAVTGVPNPQQDHALIMAKFARDCMFKMKLATNSLAPSLGEDTADLKMRIGLHSGSVTAGVLRGKKSRFQLFGDTINTASRMESNGAMGRIHVSQETADELIASGFSHWLTPRQDKIMAKGKGEMQTYWVEVYGNKTISTVSSLDT